MRAARPQALPVDADAIPDDLKALPRWVVWAYVEDVDPETGKVDYDKPPRRVGGGPASSTDPKTWATFADVLAAYRAGGLDGVGLVLSRAHPDDGDLVGVDLDHCRDPQTGAIAEWAAAIVRELDTYAEASPSGEGVRLFCYGDLPPHGRKKGEFEVYESRRYVTVTGRHIEGTPRTVERRQEQLLAVHRRFWPEPAKPAGGNGHGGGGGLHLDDAELVRKAAEAKNGEGFRRLWAGDFSAYPSASEADLALVSYLAFWCGPDRGRIDSLFRRSGLYRPKWEREDYRRRTIDKALIGRTDFYEPGRNGGAPRGPENGGPSGRGPAAAGADDPDGYRIIYDYFVQKYDPRFRRGEALYSARLGRDVRRSEACWAPTLQLVDRLADAADAPRSKHGVERDKLPKFFREWAPVAWNDVVDGLPEEQEAAEVDGSAEDDFRRRVAAALFTPVRLGSKDKETGARYPETRSLLDWLTAFAKSTTWEKVRSVEAWSRRGPAGVEVALRPDVFGQLHQRELAALSHRQFAALAEQYSVGERGRAGGERVVLLSASFLADLWTTPRDEDGRVDDDGLRGRAGAGKPVNPSTEATTV